jgi:putative ABC transport system permease protein
MAPRLGVIMQPIERYRTFFDDPHLSSLGVYLPADADSEAMVATIREQFPTTALLVRSNRTLRESSVAILDRTFAITNVLQLLATIVGLCRDFCSADCHATRAGT